MFRADAKAQVSYDYDTGRITTFLCSVQHSPDVEVSDFRHIIESMMALAACEYGLDGDFTKLVNPTGRFVLGGSYHLIKKVRIPLAREGKISLVMRNQTIQRTKSDFAEGWQTRGT